MNDLPKENIYGHFNRLVWIKQYLKREHSIMELGCGTGYMITYPLRCYGYNIEGFDLDRESIQYGIRVFCVGSTSFLCPINIRDIKKQYDVIIASEVFEHIAEGAIDSVFADIRKRLNPGGVLLVTVPNGYGWFELERFLWHKLHWGSLLERLRIISCLLKLKQLCFGEYVDAVHPSTLSPSAHVRKFSLRSVQNMLSQRGFEIIEARGSVLICGPFSNALFTGLKAIMKLNVCLGSQLAQIAAGFYVAGRRTDG